jgi:hypothetical protein
VDASTAVEGTLAVILYSEAPRTYRNCFQTELLSPSLPIPSYCPLLTLLDLRKLFDPSKLTQITSSKLEATNYLEEKSKQNAGFTWMALVTGSFFEWVTSHQGILRSIRSGGKVRRGSL